MTDGAEIIWLGELARLGEIYIGPHGKWSIARELVARGWATMEERPTQYDSAGYPRTKAGFFLVLTGQGREAHKRQQKASGDNQEEGEFTHD